MPRFLVSPPAQRRHDDGFADLMVGAPGFAPARQQIGAAFVVFGAEHFPAEIALRSLADGDGTQGFALIGGRTTGGVTPVANAGDVNGDGVDDMLIYEAHKVEQEYVRSVYLVYGRRQ